MPERLGAAEAAATARLMWTLFEPVHVVSYFAAEPRAAFEQAGLRGYWRGYFAGAAGTILYQQVEHAAAARPWSQLAPSRIGRLTEALRPVARVCAAALPFPSPVSTPAHPES